MKTLTVQPDPNDVTRSLPYPFHVDETGAVQRQEFWRGKVAHVIGFTDEPRPGNITLTWGQAWAEPERATGKYVVTSDGKEKWAVHVDPVRTPEFHE